MEKMVGTCSRMNVYVMDASKYVSRLAEKRSIPLELVPFGIISTLKRIEKQLKYGFYSYVVFYVRGRVVLREGTGKMGPVMSDSGNILADLHDVSQLEMKVIASTLDGIVGVVEHGLFLSMCDFAYIADPENVRVLKKTDLV